MDNIRASFTGKNAVILAILALGLASSGGTWALYGALRMAPAPTCEGNDILFPRTFSEISSETSSAQSATSSSAASALPPSIVTAWSDAFHGTMSKIVDAHLEQMKAPAACDRGVRIPPSSALLDLAKKLPQWSEEEAWTQLSETDMPVVALGYIMAYECALKEREIVLSDEVTYTTTRWMEDTGENSSQQTLSTSVRGDLNAREKELIRQEMLIARPTVDNTLLVLSGRTRLLPLVNALQCLELASIDIRNALSLGAQMGSLLPRATNAKNTLRNPAP